MKIKARKRYSASPLSLEVSTTVSQTCLHARQVKIRVEKHLEFSAWKKETATSQHDQEKKKESAVLREYGYRIDGIK